MKITTEQLKDNEYQCAYCHGVFEKGWTDEEAEDEKTEVFGSVPMENCAVVCDECYEGMKP